MRRFYLGTSEVRWLGQANVPLFISHRRLAPRKSFPRALTGWALDSGGFTELSMFGEWRTSARDYTAAVWRYDQEIGNLEWASPQDLMTEPEQLARTGLSVREHQRRTIANFQELQDLWPGPAYDVPWVPVLQGWTPDDYRRCIDMYYDAGVDLSQCFLVGVGSICRRQGTAEIDVILSTIQRHDPEIPLHAYGCKVTGLKRYGHRITSADSLSWSYQARRSAPLPGHRHAACNNCLTYALAWRERVLAVRPSGQMSLFDAA
ncbi:hypothetical protein [Mycobacterium sp. SMC-4]|uniref:deazapurine DNA modification protein DpdA family protein n=1 Tax=Mycobacterium sp. SMC-4 TaxID=2857059 RepID=UPI001F461C55|nr:hypothetical protein [Mycobacterium sp. SMC-4]MCF6391235.1 hypothetical protein [Mycobacterium sp. MBM]UXA21258.1 hypothetical protein KXD98_27565 [Mycobacterium sp. SMC-4]